MFGAYVVGVCIGYLEAREATKRRSERLAAMTRDERDDFYREEAAQLDRRRTEAAEVAAKALAKRAKRLWL